MRVHRILLIIAFVLSWQTVAAFDCLKGSYLFQFYDNPERSGFELHFYDSGRYQMHSYDQDTLDYVIEGKFECSKNGKKLKLSGSYIIYPTFIELFDFKYTLLSTAVHTGQGPSDTLMIGPENELYIVSKIPDKPPFVDTTVRETPKSDQMDITLPEITYVGFKLTSTSPKPKTRLYKPKQRVSIYFSDSVYFGDRLIQRGSIDGKITHVSADSVTLHVSDLYYRFQDSIWEGSYNSYGGPVVNPYTHEVTNEVKMAKSDIGTITIAPRGGKIVEAVGVTMVFAGYFGFIVGAPLLSTNFKEWTFNEQRYFRLLGASFLTVGIGVPLVFASSGKMRAVNPGKYANPKDRIWSIDPN